MGTSHFEESQTWTTKLSPLPAVGGLRMILKRAPSGVWHGFGGKIEICEDFFTSYMAESSDWEGIRLLASRKRPDGPTESPVLLVDFGSGTDKCLVYQKNRWSRTLEMGHTTWLHAKSLSDQPFFIWFEEYKEEPAKDTKRPPSTVICPNCGKDLVLYASSLESS